jgi:hypothetical protein
VTAGTFVEFTKTKATASEGIACVLAVTADDELVLEQIQEDGSTEFAGASFIFTLTS